MLMVCARILRHEAVEFVRSWQGVSHVTSHHVTIRDNAARKTNQIRCRRTRATRRMNCPQTKRWPRTRIGSNSSSVSVWSFSYSFIRSRIRCGWSSPRIGSCIKLAGRGECVSGFVFMTDLSTEAARSPQIYCQSRRITSKKLSRSARFASSGRSRSDYAQRSALVRADCVFNLDVSTRATRAEVDFSQRQPGGQ